MENRQILQKDKSMNDAKISYIVYFCLIFILCISAFLFDIFNPFVVAMDHSFSKSGLQGLFGVYIAKSTLGLINVVWRLFAYGAIGLLGLYFIKKVGLKDIVNDNIKQTKNIIIIILAGILLGIYFIWYNTLYGK